jgi:hypothetical protein
MKLAFEFELMLTIRDFLNLRYYKAATSAECKKMKVRALHQGRDWKYKRSHSL